MTVETYEQQLDLWLIGEPHHRGDRKDPRSECCPDFSCCTPELLAPLEVRRAFVLAGPREQMAFLATFLGALIAHKQATGEIDPNKRLLVVKPGQKDPT